MRRYTKMRNDGHNPLLPVDIHIPDGEAHVMPDGRLYVYGSFDALDDYYCSNIYRVASTDDMRNWKVHDVCLRAEDIPWFGNPDAPRYQGVDWKHPTRFVMENMPEITDLTSDEREAMMRAEGGPALLYAPDCIEKNGKYYLYFCMSDESEGVAVSDHPDGPFQNPVQLPCGGIDPAIFVDDDGSAYYYWGQFYSRGVKLNDNMISFDPKRVRDHLVTEEEHFFHEGSSMRKIGDTYYFVFADVERGKPTSLGYATSKSPLGPFTYRGIIIDNAACDSASWNNHGSIECFQGKWYVFYHRCSRGDKIYRRLCAEPITILPDGSIPEVRMTSQGPGEPYSSSEVIPGYQACELHGGLHIGPNSQGVEEIYNISDGDRAVFRYVKSDSAFKYAEIESEGRACVTVLLDGSLAGEVKIGKDGVTQFPIDRGAWSAKEQELTILFSGADGFALRSITLFA